MGQVRDLRGLAAREGTGMEDRKAEPGTLLSSVGSVEGGKQEESGPTITPGEGH